jgi:hypothetical protein
LTTGRRGRYLSSAALRLHEQQGKLEMKFQPKKTDVLVLIRDSVRPLSQGEMSRVEGGIPTSTLSTIFTTLQAVRPADNQ